MTAICVVGPLPPPSSGMANQCEQLALMLRAGFRLLPYLWRLWRAAGRARVMHVLANSGWAWHLLVTPAMRVAGLRGRPVIINYHGGSADAFFARTARYVLRMLAGASLGVTPSGFLQRVFSRYGLSAEVIPDIVEHGISCLLVPIGAYAEMAREAPGILQDVSLATSLGQAGVMQAQKYAWPRIRSQWLEAYRQVLV